MERTILISMPIKELESVIIDCVTACLKHNKPQQEKEKSKEFLTKKEAVKLLGITNPTIDSWVRKKILIKRKIARRVYFNRAEIEMLLNL